MYTLVCEKTGQAAVVDPSFHDRDEWEEIEEYLDGKHVRQDLCLEDGLEILENIGRLDHRASG